MRGAAGMQVLAILGGWFSTQYPALMRFEAGPLTLDEAAAPPITQRWLLIGLVVVLAAVIPLLVQLYRVFENQDRTGHTPSR
jgi:cytochrome bd-type quinol oxidase subunit 2